MIYTFYGNERTPKLYYLSIGFVTIIEVLFDSLLKTNVGKQFVIEYSGKPNKVINSFVAL